MSLSPRTLERLAALNDARDRALRDPLDRPAMDGFIQAATALADAMATDPELSGEARHEAGRVVHGGYGRLAGDIAAGRTGYRLAREEEPEGGGPPRMVLADGSGFDAAGFVRRLAGDWAAVAKVA